MKETVNIFENDFYEKYLQSALKNIEKDDCQVFNGAWDEIKKDEEAFHDLIGVPNGYPPVCD